VRPVDTPGYNSRNQTGGGQVVSGDFRVGPWQVTPSLNSISCGGTIIHLEPKVIEVLACLAAQAGQTLSKEALFQAVWPGTVVTDDVLKRCIAKLRRAFKDDAREPHIIETIPKRGYRLVAPVTAAAAVAPLPSGVAKRVTRILDELWGDAHQIRSLLVLPLDNLSSDPEQSYFADGLTEVLITTLAKISALRVLSRTTAVFYKRAQKTMHDIAHELGVDGVIEGSVLRSDGRVRITVQLLHAATDTHLWAENYERDMRDILALQAEVASAIAREIQVKVTPQEQTQLARTPAVDPDAYDEYLRGLRYWDRRTPDAIRQAIQSFECAITRDPNFAAPQACLAQCFDVLGWYGYVPPTEGCGGAKALALKALEIDPNLAQAHASLAWAVQYYDYDFQRAEAEYRRSIELDQRYSVAHYRLALTLSYLGRSEEAIAESKFSISLDPFAVAPNSSLDFVYWMAGEYDQLFAHAKRSVELHPDAPHTHWPLGRAYLEVGLFDAAIAEFQLAVECSGGATVFRAMLAETYAAAGRSDEAQEILAQLQERAHQQYVTPYMIGRVYTALGMKDEAFRWLEAAYEERAAWMVMLKRDPGLSTLRSDPRFETLLRRMNFPS
jgi:TolB-like protein/DNA-binding winged helix-turn-helix (wHTH) protein/Flp pilus assembly protein TadD